MMSFDKIPDDVLSLLEAVLDGCPPPYTPGATSGRWADAYRTAWTWQPPLLYPGRSEPDVTPHGMFALQWLWQRGKSQNGVPAAYCDIDGTPLTILYLLEDKDARWGFNKEDRHSLSNKLRRFAKKLPGRGNVCYYRYDDLRRYVDTELEKRERM